MIEDRLEEWIYWKLNIDKKERKGKERKGKEILYRDETRWNEMKWNEILFVIEMRSNKNEDEMLSDRVWKEIIISACIHVCMYQVSL